jgi:hypothetical protein
MRSKFVKSGRCNERVKYKSAKSGAMKEQFSLVHKTADLIGHSVVVKFDDVKSRDARCATV